MSTRYFVCVLEALLVMGSGAPYSRADLLDELEMNEVDFARQVSFGPFTMGETWKPFLHGLDISAEHAGKIVKELERRDPRLIPPFLESRGDYTKALESDRLVPLDRARLLVRSGKGGEVAGVIDAGGAALTDAGNPEWLLFQACRPLEDADDWDTLHEYLRVLGDGLTEPAWRAALWAEELDIAWHRNRLREALAEAANDPLKLLVWHGRLGNIRERDELAAQALADAKPGRVVELVGLARDCYAIRSAGYELWDRADLASPERIALCREFLRLPPAERFDERLRQWIARGGDALPIADQLWRWLMERANGPLEAPELLKALHERHPGDPRFRLLLAGHFMKSAPEHAVEQLEAVASMPWVPVSLPKHYYSFAVNTTFAGVWRETPDDYVAMAFTGLGGMNRQDRIEALLKRHRDWDRLDIPGKVRILAMGRMDCEMVKVALGASPDDPANDAVAGYLLAVLGQRSSDRILPKEFVDGIAGRFSALAAGSPQKPIRPIASDAARLVGLLYQAGADGDSIAAGVEATVAEVGKRGTEDLATLVVSLRECLAKYPKLSVRLPEVTGGGEVRKPESWTMATRIGEWLRLFGPPAMLRVRPVPVPRSVLAFRNPISLSGSSVMGIRRIDLLTRWSDNLETGNPNMLRGGGRAEVGKILEVLARRFGAGKPRTLLADILIDGGVLRVDDAALVADAKAGVEALFAGTREARGTEAYRYATLLIAKADDARMSKVLGELKDQPLAVRMAFLECLRAAENRMREGYPLAAKVLGAESAREANGPESRVKAAVRLMELARDNRNAGPEEIALAKEILDEAVEAGADPDEVRVAVRILETSKALDGWIEDAHDRMLKSGRSDPEVLKSLRKTVVSYSSESAGRSINIDRRILTLDPSDAQAAGNLMAVAAKEKDFALLQRCVRAMGINGVGRLGADGVTVAFGRDFAARMLDLVREQTPREGVSAMDMAGAHLLHGYFLDADPRLAAAYREWLAGLQVDWTKSRNEIVRQLVDAGRRDEAVDLIVRSHSVAKDYPGHPYQFPPRPGRIPGQGSDPFDESRLGPELELLDKTGLLGAVAARIDESGAEDPLVCAVFHLAASPDAATFEKWGIPALERLTGVSRVSAAIRMTEMFAVRPGSGPLVLRLLEERSKMADAGVDATGKEPDHRCRFAGSIISSAANHPGGEKLIASEWSAAEKALAEIGDPAMKRVAEKSLLGVLEGMLVSADAKTWQRYWDWRQTVDAPLGQLGYLPLLIAPSGFVDPVRLRQVLPRAFREVGEKFPAEYAAGWALAAVATGDHGVMESARKLMPAAAVEGSDICGLGLGDTDALIPLLGVGPEEGGETLLWWHLVTVSPMDRKGRVMDVPRCQFPALDGKTDVRILAGKKQGRLNIIREIKSASQVGQVRLKLDPGVRYLLMSATDPKTGAFRVGRMVPRAGGAGIDLDLSDGKLAERGFARWAPGGPGGMPAWKVRFSGRQEIPLAEAECPADKSLEINAWLAGLGQIEVRFMDASGARTGSVPIFAGDTYGPVWQFRTVGEGQPTRIPANTVRLVVVASVYGANDGPSDFAFSGLRLTVVEGDGASGEPGEGQGDGP